MKKQRKLILIMLAVLVVLGGAIAFLLLSDSDSDASDETSELSEEDTSLITHEESDIVAITVQNKYGSFSFYPTEVEESSDDSSDTSSDYSSGSESSTSFVYSITGYEDREVNTSTLSTAAMAFYDLDYTKEIGEVEDESQFGLDGSIVASCVYKDGSAEKIEIGDVPASSSGRYIKYNGKVYIVSVNSAYTDTMESLFTAASWDIDYLTKEAESSESSDDSSTSTETYSILESLKISGACNASGIEVAYDSETEKYNLVSPIKAEASSDKIDDLITSLLNYSANETVNLDPTDEDLESYGLKEPYAVLEIKLNGESHKITIGGEVDSSRYCLMDDDKTVYSIYQSKISDWAECNASEYREANVITDSLSDLCELKFNVDGKTSDITVTREEDESSSTDTTVYYSYTSYADGDEIVYSYINQLYSKLIDMSVLNIKQMDHEIKPYIQIKLKTFDGDSKTIEFYKSLENSSRYVVYIDGEYSCTVRSTSVDELAEEFSNFLG